MILRPGTFLQDRYEILDKIGSGGMSDVYKALCHKLKRQVAIKVLKEEFSSDSGFVSKFKMEAQAAARLSHPNIVNVYDVVDEGTLHYIVMELIEGITLKNYILKKGCLDSKEAIGIAIQVAQGIAAAHEQGIVHRDIKPEYHYRAGWKGEGSGFRDRPRRIHSDAQRYGYGIGSLYFTGTGERRIQRRPQ